MKKKIILILGLLSLLVLSGCVPETKKDTIGVKLYDTNGNLLSSTVSLQAIVGGISNVGSMALVINTKNDGDYPLDVSIDFSGETILINAFDKVVPSHFMLGIGDEKSFSTDKIDVNDLKEGDNLIEANIIGLYTNEQGYVQEIRTTSKKVINVQHEEKKASIDVKITDPYPQCAATIDCPPDCMFKCINGQCIKTELPPKPEGDYDCVMKYPICRWECTSLVPLPEVKKEPIIMPSTTIECENIGGYCIESTSKCPTGLLGYGRCDPITVEMKTWICCIPSNII